MRVSKKETAEAERRRRFASVAIDYNVIVETAAVKAVQPLERVEKQLCGLLDRTMDGVMEFDDTWSKGDAAPLPQADEDDENGVVLFSANVKTRSSQPDNLVPARGVATDSHLVAEEAEPLPKAVVTRRSEWAGAGWSEASDVEDAAVGVELDVVERNDEALIFEEAVDAVSLFSEKVIAGRQMYKRQREVTVQSPIDRSALALLCVDGKSLLESSQSNAVLPVDAVEQFLPGHAVVIPHPGEQPPSPDLHRANAPKKPKVHKRWVFNQIRDEVIEGLVTKRQRKRHPGILRKMRKSLPEMMKADLIEDVYEPVVATAEKVQPVVDSVALARAAKMKSGGKKIPKNLLFAAKLG